MTLHISPYLEQPARTEAQARQDRIDRIARNLVQRAPYSCRKFAEGAGGGADWVLHSFIWQWNYDREPECF